jgi:hypothetical protein
MENGLIDEFNLVLTPVTVGNGQHLFAEVHDASQLQLVDVERFASGVVRLVYTPKEVQNRELLQAVDNELEAAQSNGLRYETFEPEANPASLLKKGKWT